LVDGGFRSADGVDEVLSRKIEIYELNKFLEVGKLKSQLVTCGEIAPATDAKPIPG
jgi:hypothetical protein